MHGKLYWLNFKKIKENNNNKMKYKAVLFDLDGTLLNTLKDIAISANTVLSNNGYPVHDIYSYKKFVGDGMESLVRRILPEDQKDESVVQKCLKELSEIYSQGWYNRTGLYPGIKEMLTELQRKKIRLSIFSNKPHEFTTAHVEYFLSEWKFEAVFGIKEGIPKKPDPYAAIEISKIMSIPPEEFIYVGDTNTDMKTAIGAGMLPVGVLWGFRDEKELTDSGAKIIINKPEELLNLI